MAKITDKIIEALLRWCNIGAYDIVVPNWYEGHWEMDVMKITSSHYQIEYEVKVSRSDFNADFKKSKNHWLEGQVNKHKQIQEGKRANRFFFVVPKGLIKVEEVPKYAGLIYYDEEHNVLEVVKNATLIHKRPFTKYREIATKLSFREFYLRQDFRKYKKIVEKQVNQ